MADEESRPNVGVPGADRVHKEGTEYLKEQVEQNQPVQQGEGTVSHTKPDRISTPQPPASNPGAEDATAGISQGAGGVSSTAHIESPVPTEEEGASDSIVNTVKSFLGFGAGGSSSTERTAAEADANSQARNVNSADTATAAIVGGTSGIAAGQSADLVDRTRTTAPAPTVASSGEDPTTAATTTSSTAMETTKKADSGAAAATSSDPATATHESSVPKGEGIEGKDPVESTEEMSEQAEKPPVPASGKSMENRDAIPTAGGQKLGEKHWGESQVVPDNPKVRDEGVASKDGQPTSEVADNTAKNTGGATGGPNSSTEEKKSLVDKIKDKLPGGSK